MAWGTLLQPDLVVEGSILNLQPEILHAFGLEGLVLDVDETLVPLKSSEISPALQQWVEEARQSLKLSLLSNNLSEARIARIAESLNLSYLHGAGKPSRRKLRLAVAEMQLPVERVGMVGDRLFTDVLAGNRLGLFTILVEPMTDLGESLYHSRSLEIWISQILGASLSAKHKVTNSYKSLKS
ncbi:hydrolase [Neosynechococcus sphagnicola sy1]|uniref:Hydrolase n=1 Tax=Neosynechococcus sphagnicola sy1 TaxID=1497020 RepID=A0A098TH97_9CYAN|nr:YqeG family HAD IIIA-type phosphatase [Neosynechococcus sphagnicola]KGF71459.1 hydrolase [Neosynechococcus sphagnicola sy1]